MVERRALLEMMAAGGAAAVCTGAASAEQVSLRRPAGPNAERSTEYQAAIRTARAYLEAHRQEYGLPGITLSVADAEGFRVALSTGWSDMEARAPLTPEHFVQIGSISKSFAALAALRLSDLGKLDLDAIVQDLAPDCRISSRVPVAVRHLITHRSGLPRDDVQLLEDVYVPAFEPGSRYHYSNLGYTILGDVIAKAAGNSYNQWLKKSVLTALGMTGARSSILNAERDLYAVGYQPYYGDRPFPVGGRLAPSSWVNETSASGCIGATPTQMATFMQFLIEVGSGRPVGWLSEASQRLFVNAPTDPGNEGESYAFGIRVVRRNDREYLQHNGGMAAFRSSMVVDPAGGVGAFVSVNAGPGQSYFPQEVAEYVTVLFRAARENAALPPPPQPFSATRVSDVAQMVGSFRSRTGGEIALIAKGDGLALVTDGIARPLQPVGVGGFIALGPGDESVGLSVDVDEGVAISIGWQSTVYTRAGLPIPAASAGNVDRFAGVYDSGSPWTGMFSLVAREGQLLVDGLVPLVPTADGNFSIDPDMLPSEHIRFDRDIDGKPQRATAFGVRFMRT